MVIWRWAAGAPNSASGWWPVLILAVVLLLPDTVGISLAGSGIQLRDVAQTAQDAKAIATEFKRLIDAGQGEGQVAADIHKAAEAEAAGEAPALVEDLAGEFLG